MLLAVRNRPQSSLLVTCLHAGFALTGIGTNLLGCALPVLSSTWHLNDSQAGTLLAAQFAGSSCGALLVRSRLFSSILQGYFLLALCAALIGLSSSHLRLPLFFGMGLGIGIAMTATSMMMARIYNTTSASSLSLLNATWGFGAVICPVIVIFWIRNNAATTIFFAMSVAVALVLLLLAMQRRTIPGIQADMENAIRGKSNLHLLLVLGSITFLYVGVEASMGSWMMSLVHRSHITSMLLPPAAMSLFWIALVLGRAITPMVLKYMSDTLLLTVCLSVTILSVLSLLVDNAAGSGLISAAFAGLMLAPVFPLSIAKVLASADGPSQSKWIFALCGLGGAVFPWMTGQVAHRTGSLRMGLLAPLLAACLMLLLHLRLQLLGNIPGAKNKA